MRSGKSETWGTGWFTFAAMQNHQVTLHVEGMTCGHCARAVKELAEEVSGVETATVDLAAKEAYISLTDPSISTQTIIDNINSTNSYKAQLK